MNIKGYELGLRGHDIANNFTDMCKNANDNGVKNLQFALAKTVNEINFDTAGYDAVLSDKIKTVLDSFDLSVIVLGCYINPVDENPAAQKTQLKRFENFISYAKDFKAVVIGTETGYILGESKDVIDVEKTHSEENYQLFLNNLKPLVKKAEEENVVIGIEPVWECTICTVSVMKRLLDDISSDNLAVILDISNMINAENFPKQKEMINEAFDVLGDKIRVIHLKDFTMEDNKKSFAAAGCGSLEIELLIKRANELKNPPEIILDALPLNLYKETVERLKDIF